MAQYIFTTKIPERLRKVIKPGDIINGDVIESINEDGSWRVKLSPEDAPKAVVEESVKCL
jgi:hypothetical protein